VRFICGLQAPEDLVVVPGGQWVMAGAFSGSGGLYAIRVSDRTPTLVYPHRLVARSARRQGLSHVSGRARCGG
jgi:hypothetical protein